MLTKEHGIADYKLKQIIPERLTPKFHGNYPDYAEQMVKVYEEGNDKTRRELHKAIHKIFEAEPDCPVRRIAAFCKLLDDASVYNRDIPGKAANLRKKVFRLAAGSHPLVQKVDRFFENCESDVKKKIADEIEIPWETIEKNLFADVTDYHRLKEFKGFEKPGELLTRYNIGQLQVALFRATKMTIWAGADFKTIIRYAKLAQLMHTIKPLRDGRYCISFDGPASVLRNTRRYGVNMAKFLPSLICCSDWSLEAKIATRREGYYVNLKISHNDRFKSHLSLCGEFDSSVEENFAQKWGDGARNGWRLLRESEVLSKRQKVFSPDFVLQHEDGRKVLLEIAGFWTPEYLKDKALTIMAFKDYNILLAVSESTVDKIPELPVPVIPYKSALVLSDILDYLDVYQTL